MIILKKNNSTELLANLHSIKNNMNEWQIVKVNIREVSGISTSDAIKMLYNQYEKTEGILYRGKQNTIFMVIKLGSRTSMERIKEEMEGHLPEHSCRIKALKMSAVGLKQLQVDILQNTQTLKMDQSLYQKRLHRKANTILIVDDDSFVRKSLAKLVGHFGNTIEVEKSSDVVLKYLECNPDVVILDIHMPDKNGLDVLDDLLDVDIDSYVVMLTGDSCQENVLLAVNKGAVGFLVKPPIKDRLNDYINECSTIH